MPTETLVRGESALKIYQISALQMLEICARHRFGQEIKTQSAAAMGAYCEATAVDSHAIPAPHFLRQMRGGNFQFSVIAIRTRRNHTADFFDQTGEHDKELSVLSFKESATMHLRRKP